MAMFFNQRFAAKRMAAKLRRVECERVQDLNKAFDQNRLLKLP